MHAQVTKDHAHAANGFEDKLDAAWQSGERFDCTRHIRRSWQKVALALARQHVFLANTSAITGKVVASMIFGCVFMFQFQLANALEPASLLPVRYA